SAIRVAIRPYSMAVAPDSFLMNCARVLSIAVTPVEIAVTLIFGNLPSPYRIVSDFRDRSNHRITMSNGRCEAWGTSEHALKFLQGVKRTGTCPGCGRHAPQSYPHETQ